MTARKTAADDAENWLTLWDAIAKFTSWERAGAAGEKMPQAVWHELASKIAEGTITWKARRSRSGGVLEDMRVGNFMDYRLAKPGSTPATVVLESVAGDERLYDPRFAAIRQTWKGERRWATIINDPALEPWMTAWAAAAKRRPAGAEAPAAKWNEGKPPSREDLFGYVEEKFDIKVRNQFDGGRSKRFGLSLLNSLLEANGLELLPGRSKAGSRAMRAKTRKVPRRRSGISP